MATRDLSLVLSDDVLIHARALDELLHEGDPDELRARFVLGWFHWYRFLALPQGHDENDSLLALHMLTACFIAGADGLPEPLLPTLAKHAVPRAHSLLQQALDSGEPGLASETVELWTRIVDVTPSDDPDKPARMSNLAMALQIRFERIGSRSDLDAAIAAATAALDTAAPDAPLRASMESNLGVSLHDRFLDTGAEADLEAAVSATQAALELTPISDLARPARLANLSNVLGTRFERLGAWGDLSTSIEASRKAAEADPTRPRYWSSVAKGLLWRYERTEAQADLDAAVAAIQAAVKAAPEGHPDHIPMMSRLGIVLACRFDRVGALADLDAAITASESAAQLLTNQIDRAGATLNLASMLLKRFERTGYEADFDEVIRAGRAAVEALPTDHPALLLGLTTLARALRARFEQTGAQTDFDEAQSLFERAVNVESSPPSFRIHVAREGASFAARSAPGRGADLLTLAVGLLPAVAPRQLQRTDQQNALSTFAGLAADAAALVLMDAAAPATARAARAIELLEAGRAVLLSQALEARDDLADLSHREPALAASFVELRQKLDEPVADAQHLSSPTDDWASVGSLRAGEERSRLAREFAATLQQIRDLDDRFSTFGLPPNIEDLAPEAAEGPIVVFNISRYRSDALLVTEAGIRSLELPGLRYRVLIPQIEAFYGALAIALDPKAPPADWREAESKLSRILEWLWDYATGPVLHALGFAEKPPDGSRWPRIWLLAGGALGILPLHAAGYHSDPLEDPGRRSVLDRVIPSYTPSIRALRHARRPEPRSARQQRALIVAMPTTPGVPGRLRHASDEAAKVASHLPGSLVLVERGDEERDIPATLLGIPTKVAVLEHLPECAIAHFVCHGATNITDPSKSLLLLHDHDHDPLAVASLASVVLDYSELAYLSACSTASTWDPRLGDEAIHLASAFQVVGFRAVIGTLWEIDDAIAMTMADTFYTALHSSTGPLDTTRAAQALHAAVCSVRDEFPDNPSVWAAFLSTGR